MDLYPLTYFSGCYGVTLCSSTLFTLLTMGLMTLQVPMLEDWAYHLWFKIDRKFIVKRAMHIVLWGEEVKNLPFCF